MGARNEEAEINDEVIKQTKTLWEQQGKTWEINPPLASHFGGVWERAIGQVRQILEGYLLSRKQSHLTREEFHTMLLHAAAIVNSTPLWEPPENPNLPEPITPQHLLTQRDDSCSIKENRPTVYSEKDLQAYGKNRWKRIEAIAEEFWKLWQHYLFQIGTKREKWIKPERNTMVGDVVLMKDKDQPRSKWSTGTITQIIPSKDGLIRRVVVKPHSREDKSTTQTPRERAVHDLVLIKALSEQNQPPEDCRKDPKAPKDAQILLGQMDMYDPNEITSPVTEMPQLPKNDRPPTQNHTYTESDCNVLQDLADFFMEGIKANRNNPKNKEDQPRIETHEITDNWPLALLPHHQEMEDSNNIDHNIRTNQEIYAIEQQINNARKKEAQAKKRVQVLGLHIQQLSDKKARLLQEQQQSASSWIRSRQTMDQEKETTPQPMKIENPKKKVQWLDNGTNSPLSHVQPFERHDNHMNSFPQMKPTTSTRYYTRPLPKPVQDTTKYNLAIKRRFQDKRNLEIIFPGRSRKIMQLFNNQLAKSGCQPQVTVTDGREPSITTPQQQLTPTGKEPIQKLIQMYNNPNLNPLWIPANLTQRFLQAAEENTSKGIETLGVLMGQKKGNKYNITHLVIPKQTGNPNNCCTKHEEELGYIQEDLNLITLGTIHTHPTQNAFLSSVDLHTQFRLQYLLPEAISIVCAPRYNQIGYFNITPGQAMDYLKNCKAKGFHDHPAGFPLYQAPNHLQNQPMTDVEFLDLRRYILP